MFDKTRDWMWEHKITTGIGAVIVAGLAAYYGVPPEYSAPVLDTICDALSLCPRV